MRLSIILALMALAGCATEPEIRYVTKVERVEIPVPVSSCPGFTARGAYAMDHITVDTSPFEKIKACLVERRQRIAETEELLEALSACSGP